MTHIAQEGVFHRLTIVPMIVALENLGRILDKALAYASVANLDSDTLLSARLYPDMFSLIQQLQYTLFIPADFAQHFALELPPRIGYEEKSFAEVQANLDLAISYLRTVTPDCMDERAQLVVPIFFDGNQGLSAENYASQLVMPDFYFHLTIVYAILRHNGVPLGKADFIGKLVTTPYVSN